MNDTKYVGHNPVRILHRAEYNRAGERNMRMLQQLKDFGNKIVTAYQNHKNSDCHQLTGNFNISMRLHKKSAPEGGTNVSADGNVSCALLDVLLVACGLMLVGCLLQGICRILRKF